MNLSSNLCPFSLAKYSINCYFDGLKFALSFDKPYPTAGLQVYVVEGDCLIGLISLNINTGYGFAYGC